MSETVYLAEYVNLVNEARVPVGHAPKVLRENSLLFDGERPVCFCCGEACAATLEKGSTVVQLMDIYYRGSTIATILKRIKNLRKIFQVAEKDAILWFTNVDWTLFAYLALTGEKRRMIATLYRDVAEDCRSYPSRLRRWIGALAIRGMRYISLYIVTNPSLHLFDNELHLPDFYYNDFYAPYRAAEKKERIVCLGSMRNTKDLCAVIKHFNHTGIEVIIGGDFLDKLEYEEARALAGENITVFDRALSTEEYYTLLGSSRYCILPYRYERYKNATSGILLECAFLDVIPIAPNWLLQNNHLKGLGYDSITELPVSKSELLDKTRDIRNDISDYQIDILRQKLNRGIKEFCI